MSLGRLLSDLVPESEGWAIDLPDDWTQGRTAYGGLTAALALEAALRLGLELPPLRAAQIAFVGPAAGRLLIRARLLREGRSATAIAASIDTACGPATRALLTFGRPRASAITLAAPRMEDLPSPLSLASRQAPDGPAFARHFDLRWMGGSLPLSGPEASPRYQLWARHRDASSVDPMVALLALGDSPPPAAFALFRRPAPLSSMTWSLDIVGPPGPADSWHLLKADLRSAAEGYAVQSMETRDEQGRLVAVGRQTVAIFDGA